MLPGSQPQPEPWAWQARPVTLASVSPSGLVGALRTPRRSCSTDSSPASCGRMCTRRRCVGLRPASSPAHLHLLTLGDPHLLTPTHICSHPHPHEEAFEDCSSMLPAHVVLCFLLSAGPTSSRPWPVLAAWLTDPGRWSLGMLGVSPQAYFHPVGSVPFLCRLHAATWTSP